MAGGFVTHIVYDGDNAWSDFNAAGSVAAKYLFSDRIDGNLAKWTLSLDTQWYLTDKLGSIRCLVNASGIYTEKSSFDSFGAHMVIESSINLDRFGFTGREHVVGEIINYRSRLYSATNGKFASEDKMDFTAGDNNLHRYAFNNPLSYTDPTGNLTATEYSIVHFAVKSATVGVSVHLFCQLVIKDDGRVTYSSVVKSAASGILGSVAFKAVSIFGYLGGLAGSQMALAEGGFEILQLLKECDAIDL